MLKRLLSHENITALLLALLILAVVIATVDQAPEWIYQGY
jgi:hypothetical protein